MLLNLYMPFQEYAKLLQEKEQRRYERRQREKELARERKLLEREQNQDVTSVLPEGGGRQGVCS